MIAVLLHESANNVGFWQDFLDVATDPAHLLAEASFELVTGVMLYPIARMIWKRWIKRHDLEVHGHE